MFLVCGEALFDFFLEDEQGPEAATYSARAGGSPFNVAIGLLRLGHDAGLLTGLSRDLLGQRLEQVLAAEGVSTAYAIRTSRPSTLSLVGLDAAGVPAYQFYDNGSAGTGVTEADLPDLGAEVGGLHFGSYSLAVAPAADAFAALARGKGDRFVSVDPNVRPTVEPDMDVWRERLAALFPLADLVKVSTEDLALLWPGVATETVASDLIAKGVGLVVVTDGGEGGDGLDFRRTSCNGDSTTRERRRYRRRGRHVSGGVARTAAGRSGRTGSRDGGNGCAGARGPADLRGARRGDYLLAARRRPAAR